MAKKLLTYVLWGSKSRYWHNIPYLLIANSCLYLDFSMRFYVHKDSLNHPFVLFLKEAEKKFENVELEIEDIPYKGTQLTTLRMKPLWEEGIDYLFCRDVDYALNSLEKKCVNYFLGQDECIIHNIRGCSSHRLPLMAGLIGFDVKQVFERIKSIAPTFDDYIEWGLANVPFCKTWQWECDQFLLRDFFGHVSLYNAILDCPWGTAWVRLENFPNLQLCQSSKYNERELEYCKTSVLDFIDSLFNIPSQWNNFSKFIGRAWTCDSKNLEILVNLVNNEMSEVVKKIFVDNFGGIKY